MNRRDYFAGQALAGILACHRVSGSDQEQAKAAYAVADAMIGASGEKDCIAGGRETKTCGIRFDGRTEFNGLVAVETNCGHLWFMAGNDKQAFAVKSCPACGGRIVVKGE